MRQKKSKYSLLDTWSRARLVRTLNLRSENPGASFVLKAVDKERQTRPFYLHFFSLRFAMAGAKYLIHGMLHSLNDLPTTFSSLHTYADLANNHA